MHTIGKYFLTFSVLAFIAMPAVADENYICKKLEDEATYGEKSDHKFLIQGKDGWVFRTEKDFKEDFSLQPETLALFSQLEHALGLKGVALVSVLPPTRSLVAYDYAPSTHPRLKPFDFDKASASYRQFIDDLDKVGIRPLNYDDILTGKTSFFYKRDHHWTTEGAKLSASKTADIIKKLPAYKKIGKEEFLTTQGEEAELGGSLNNYIRKQCKNESPYEKSPNFTTARAAIASSESDLFGDTRKPDIVLVGTSNCVEGAPSFANFNGFLQQELSAPVTNLSIGGAGVDTPILSWLNSDDYQKNPPKIAVWEIATHYNYNQSLITNMMRQAIPAAYGACSGKALVKETTAKIEKESQPLFKDLEAENLTDGQYYVHLLFDQPVKEDVTLSFRQVSSKSTAFEFKRADRSGPERSYYFMPKAKDETSLKTVTVKTPKDMAGMQITAQLCRVPKIKKLGLW